MHLHTLARYMTIIGRSLSESHTGLSMNTGNILYVMCMDCDNDKIGLKSHSSFMNILYVACMDGENNRIQCKNGE